MPARVYTEKHLKFLKEQFPLLSVDDLVLAFNKKFKMKKTKVQIRSVLAIKKIHCGRKGNERLGRQRRWYTDKQELFIRNRCEKVTKKELVVLFNKRFKGNMTLSKMKAFFANRGISSGRITRFAKGNLPWNNGTKGQGLTGPNRGSFKTGDIPPNSKKLWAERVCSKDGYILMKVPERNPYTGSDTRYKHKHVWIYEQIHGPVPKGSVVIFKDQDSRNFSPDNLECIKRADLVRLNQIGYKDVPDEVKPSVLALAKLRTKMGEMRRKKAEGV